MTPDRWQQVETLYQAALERGRGCSTTRAATALRQGLGVVAAGFEEANARADALTGNCQPGRRN
jgi:hypothetical protein